MVKIAHLSSAHPADDTRLRDRECRSIATAGYDVILIAIAEQDGRDGDIEVLAIPKPPSRLKRLTQNIPRVLKRALSVDADLYHFHDPELILVGLILRLKGKKVIFDIHEDFPSEAYGKFYLPRWAQHIASIGARFIFFLAHQFLSAVVVVHDDIARKFPRQWVAVIQNFPNEDEFEIAQGTAKPFRDRPNDIVFTGALNEIRSAVEIVEALALISEEMNVRLKLVGRITSETLRKRLEGMPGWARVDETGWVAADEMRAVMQNVRSGLVLYYNLPNHVNAQPRKLFEYMAAGLPVVASRFPKWQRIVEDADCGLLADPVDPREIADQIMALVRDPDKAQRMGENGVKAIVSSYSWKNEERKLLELYHELVGPPDQ